MAADRALHPQHEEPRLPEIRRLLAGEFDTVDWRATQSLLPVIAFLVLNEVSTAHVAILGSFLASAFVFYTNRDRGVIRALAIMAFVVIAGSAATGLVANSAKAFAAQNIVSDFTIALVGIGSVVWGKPLVGAVARDTIPALRTLIEPQHRTFTYLTLCFAGIQIFTGVVRIFMLDGMGASEYTLMSRVMGLPLSIFFYALCYFAIKRVAYSRMAQRSNGIEALPAPQPA